MKNFILLTIKKHLHSVSKINLSLKLKSFLLLFLLLISSSFLAQGVTFSTPVIVGNEVTVTSIGTGTGKFKVPCGVTAITVETWGAGGAGGGTQYWLGGEDRTGGGGSGGGYSRKELKVDALEDYDVVVGTGGIGVKNGNGQEGGFSSFNVDKVRANGGKGGRGSQRNPLINFGAGGLINDVGIGTTQHSGGLGFSGAASRSGSGGGGANSTSNGGNGTPNGGGAGGTGIVTVGKGADGVTANGAKNGNVGGSPGAGGSGGSTTGFLVRYDPSAGGAGGNGLVRISYNRSVSIETPFITICSGTPVTFSATPTNLGTVSYQWKKNGTNVGTNLANFKTTELQNGDEISVTSTSTCTGVGPLTSNKISVTVGDGIPTKYNGTTWSDGIPNINKKAVFESDYNLAGNIIACNCEVKKGKTLTVNSLFSITIQNNIINNGTIIVESDGNLIQLNDNGQYIIDPLTVPIPTFAVKRKANIKRQDYVYWSSPVTGQQLKDFSKGTLDNRFLEYREVDDYFEPVGDVYLNFLVGKGYAIRADNRYPTWTFPAPPDVYRDFMGTFTGVPNNGIKAFQLKRTRNGYNLVGNPYPSNINLAGDNGLLKINEDNIVPIAYFWNNRVQNVPQAGSNYNGDNYAVYNKAGGTPATGSTVKPDGIVKVGQGFIIQATAGANDKELVFKNINRDATAGANGFYDRQAGSKDRFWLQLTTPSQDFNTILIAYMPDATNSFELGYDAPLMGLSSDALFSTLENEKLKIQARQYPLNVNDIVSLGTNHYTSGKHVISIQEAEGIFANGQNIYLKDKQTNTITNLSLEDYIFDVNAGLTEGRFEIVYKPQGVLATENIIIENLVVYRSGTDFIVNSPNKKIIDLEMFDSSGRLIYKVRPNTMKTTIPTGSISQGVYILKINIEGTILTRKILR